MEFSQMWDQLPQDIRWQFESHATNLTVKRGEHIYRQGDKPKGIYFVRHGLVGLTKLGVSGKEHLLRFFREGQFFGHRSLFSQEDYHGTAISLEVSKLKLIPGEIIMKTLEVYPALLLNVVNVLARELRRCENQHVLVLDNQINVRVAQSLIYLKDLHPEHTWTRQEIANFCASTVSTVIKSLAELENMGLIKQEGRTIKLIDRERLVSMQDDDR